MSCPLRRFDDVKLQTPSRPTNTAAVKELADRLAAMKQERQKQNGMWLSEESQTETPFFASSTRDAAKTQNQKERR
jgi:hypothetical protein